ncbi:MAG: sel1 repeat family protein [Clostridia bacterium]|nr:sel1 repeat family protein [Clostridia bacterium]
MCYKYEDFKDDYIDDEDYFGMEDEFAFIHTLIGAYKGNVKYMRVMGDIYSSRGHGVIVDYKKAAYWYKMAADCGDNNSLLLLADLYYAFDRWGFPHDYEKAYGLYELAAEEGEIKGIARLGVMNLYGIGCEKDVAEGCKLIEIAAKKGEREACYEYAHMLEADGAEGWLDYLKKSAEQAYGKAGWEIITRFGEKLTDLQFIKYLSCACYDYSTPGYSPAEALYMYAECLMNGRHMRKNLNSAKSFYRDAAEEGSKEAAEALKKYFPE